MEKVKSFAPTVNHYVADVFVGPKGLSPIEEGKEESFGPGATVNRKTGIIEIQPNGATLTVPSCALSPDSALHQAWMREVGDE